jgi:hypothetical protein
MILLAAVLSGMCAISANADPAVPTETNTAAIAHVSLGSLDQLSTVAADVSLPLPGFLTAPGLEQMFPFIGADGMRKDLPVSLDYVAGGNLQPAQMAMFFLPLAAGHAPIATFVQQGQAMGADGALVNGIPFRRIGNYLVWGGTAEIVTAIAPEKLPDRKPDNPLLEIVYDARLFREVAPKVLEDYRTSQLDPAVTAGKSPSELAGQRVAVDAMTRGLDRLLFRLERKEDLFRITTQIEPSPTFTAHEYRKPGLPEDCAFRVDWQPPHDWVRQGMEKIANLSGRDEFFKAAPGGPKNQAAFEELLVRCINTLADGGEATYGMELLDDGPVFYSVTQSEAPRDVHAEFADIKQRADSLETDNKKITEVSSYKLTNGDLAFRMTGFGDDGKPVFYVDSLDRGNTRMTTICKTDMHALERLLTALPAGPLKDPASGWIDGKQTMSLIADFGKMNPALTDEDRELLNKVLKAQRVSWTVNTADHRFNIVFDVPVQLVKNVTQNMDGLQQVMTKASAAK